MGKIFMLKEGKITILEERRFDAESVLQEVLERIPEVINLDEVGVTEPFMVIGREVWTPAGSIDVLGIDGDGVLTVIEAKLARNPQIRREVVGQTLEYAAQVISNWTVHNVIEIANRYFASETASPTVKNRNLLEVLAEPMTPEDEGVSQDDIIGAIESNLRKGRIRIIVVSDSVPETLRDTVSFISTHSSFDILVLQIRAYEKEGLKVFVPTVFGYDRGSGPMLEPIRWDEERFFKALERMGDRQVYDIARDLYDFSLKHAAEVRWGRGKQKGSFSYFTEFAGQRFGLFSVYTSGQLALSLGNLKHRLPSTSIEKFRAELNKLPGFKLGEMAPSEYPMVNLTLLATDQVREAFKGMVLQLDQACREESST